MSTTEMTMIETADGTIFWECSACTAQLKDKRGFEKKNKTCPECGSEITRFHGLYDEDGEVLK